MRFSPTATLCALMILTACSDLPRGAAVQRDILKPAPKDSSAAPIAVYPVTADFLSDLAVWPQSAPAPLPWISGSAGSKAQIIRSGDQLDVQIWDSGENSLLTRPDQPATALTGLRVSETGMVFLPYVGAVKVGDRTPESARQLIQRQMEEIAPAAQVQLTMAEGRGNSVDLVSGVARPGPLPLPDQNFSLLSAISAGGGVDPALNNPQIRLIRRGKVYGTALKRLYDDPRLDTRLHPGDKIIVHPDARYFLSLGAAGKEAQIPFNAERLSALDALALIGGVQDNRANPAAILILRSYGAQALSHSGAGPSQSRVVFTLDLTSSDGLFSARHFEIAPGDLVLTTESPVTNTRTILGLVGSLFGLAGAAGTLSD